MQYYEKFDQISYEIGMIECFCEMVATGVKPLALSPAISIKNYEIIGKISDVIVKKYNIKNYLEKKLISTGLTSDDYIKDKYVILYYKEDKVIKEYFNLKLRINELQEKGVYDSREKEKALTEFKRILGYSKT